MKKTICPQCGRRLTMPAQSGVVTCDGCAFQFNPGFVWVAPPALWRRIVGALLLVLGGLMLFVEVPMAVMLYNAKDRHFVTRMIGMFLWPTLAISAGFALAGGTIIHEVRTPPKEAEPEETRETWEEE
jgi:hypothetical protein